MDFAIIVQEPDPSKYHSLRIPASDQWGLIMRRDSPLAQHSCIHLHDLMDIPLILSRQAMGTEMPKWFGETQDRLHIVATYDLLFNTSVMVREGFGCVLGFDGLVYTGPDSDLCFRPLEPALTSSITRISRAGKAARQKKLCIQGFSVYSGGDARPASNSSSRYVD